MATTEHQAIVRIRCHNGDVEEFKRLSAQCMEIVRAQDTGTLQYDTYGPPRTPSNRMLHEPVRLARRLEEFDFDRTYINGATASWRPRTWCRATAPTS